MANKILVLDGHPNAHRFCSSLAQSYAEGARSSGAEVQYLELSSLQFDSTLETNENSQQNQEESIKQFQELLLWCNHFVVVYPTWWAGMPAKLKGLFDRAMLPGFAFNYRKDSPLWDKLLQGRTAHVIVTMDTPDFIDRFYMRRAGLKMLTKGILAFCGFTPVSTTIIGSVRKLSITQREAWLKKVRAIAIKQSK